MQKQTAVKLLLFVSFFFLFTLVNPSVKASGYEDMNSNASSVHVYTGTYEVSRDSSGEYKKVVYADTGGSKVVKISNGQELNNWDKEFVYTDQVGSTQFSVDSDGSISPEFKDNNNNLNKLRYFAYGSTISSTDVSTLPVADTYTGQKIDSELDLMYYNARYYDPVRGRFIQADSVNDGLNRYMYVSGNPTNANDPSGNWENEEGTNPSKADLQDAKNAAKQARLRQKEHQDYIDKGVWAFAEAFATWYNETGEKTFSNNPCEWTHLCDSNGFEGASNAEYGFEHAHNIYKYTKSDMLFQTFAQGEIHAISISEKIVTKNVGSFSDYDYVFLNSSQLEDINVALVITIKVIESPEYPGDLTIDSFIGDSAIAYSQESVGYKWDFSSYDSSGNYVYTLSSLAATLRIFQGRENGGGGFSSFTTDRSNLNLDLFQYYNNRIGPNGKHTWYERANAIYNSIYNFATNNPEYSWLINNLLQ